MTTAEVIAAMEDAPLLGFKEIKRIPESSGVYTAWTLSGGPCLYVGKATSLRGRIRSHFSGQRGGDQFCLYVYDRYVCPGRPSGSPGTGNQLTVAANRETAEWIRSNVQFRLVNAPASEISELETRMRQRLKPLLNSLNADNKNGV